VVRRNTDDLKHAARALLKEAVWWATNNHHPGTQPDIALFATRRGASTWLMELLAANPGVKALNQPVEITTGVLTPGQARRIPKFHLGEIVHLDAVTEPMLRSYLDTVFSGAVPVNAPVRVWRAEFHLRTDRLLLKILGAKSIAPWIDDNYRVDVVHLLRHPIPQSLSCLRNGWTLTLPAFLDSQWFVANYLGEHEGFCRDVMTAGPSLEAFVLNWVCENLVMLRAAPTRPAWIRVRYEDLLVDAATELRRVAAVLDLPDVGAMERQLSAPSVTSGRSTSERRSAMVSGDRRALVGDWRAKVDDDSLAASNAVMDRFGVDVYADLT
jgi:hypothetical protein